jgi:hypothetical protein
MLAGCLSTDSSNQSDTHRPGIDYGYSAWLTPLIPNDNSTPVTANVRVFDMNGDGYDEIFFTEPIAGQIGWRDSACLDGQQCYTFRSGLGAPVRVAVADLDNDNQNEVIVSDIGILHPSNEKFGRVLSLENNQTTVLYSGLGRTVCAEPGDLDGDGDLDLTLCEFGHEEGSVSWLEQNETGNWTRHILDPRPGSIHALPYDFDNDGDLDIVASISQLSEEIMLYRNNGTGHFTLESLFNSDDTHYGMSGLRIVDFDLDGDADIIFTNGDTMDGDIPSGIDPNELHGVAWLENDGIGSFTYHDLIRTWGAYDTAMNDIDNDGDIDIVIICLQMEGQFPVDTPRDQIIILEAKDGEWIEHSFQFEENYRILTVDIMNGQLVVGSHDPLNQGGTLYRLAHLQIEPWEP